VRFRLTEGSNGAVVPAARSRRESLFRRIIRVLCMAFGPRRCGAHLLNLKRFGARTAISTLPFQRERAVDIGVVQIHCHILCAETELHRHLADMRSTPWQAHTALQPARFDCLAASFPGCLYIRAPMPRGGGIEEAKRPANSCSHDPLGAAS
jgi:hypothetical protein